jgi:GlpG protein
LRQIGTLPKGHDVKVLEDHLLGLGMTTRFDDRPEGWVVWVYNEDHFAKAQQELEAFRDNPGDPRYQAASEEAVRVRQKQKLAEKQFRKNVVDMSQRWGRVPWRRRPLTLALLSACIAVYLSTQSPSLSGPLERGMYLLTYHHDPQGFEHWDGLEAVRRGEVWRLITPIFLHFGPIHLLGNMMWLYYLGTVIEVRRGSLWLAVLVFGSAIVSNLGQYVLEGPSRFGGMSGVVYALFGYVWMKTLYHPLEGMFVDSRNVSLMLLWFVLCTTGAVGPIANGAHGVGLVVGIVLGLSPL